MRSIVEYLKHKPNLKGYIFDKGELKRLARACGLSTQDARRELRKQGFILTKNDHGIAVWKVGSAVTESRKTSFELQIGSSITERSGG